MKYPELLNLSRERLQNPSTYREIEFLDFFVLEDMVKSYGAFSGKRERVGNRHDDGFEYKAQDFLWEREIRVGERALIALGYFDDETHIKALPMLRDRTKMPDYHPAIYDDYRRMMDSFRPAGYPDSFEGQVFKKGNEQVLAVRTMRMPDYQRSEAVATVSRELANTAIVVSHSSYLMHEIYRDGEVDYIEIET